MTEAVRKSEATDNGLNRRRVLLGGAGFVAVAGSGRIELAAVAKRTIFRGAAIVLAEA